MKHQRIVAAWSFATALLLSPVIAEPVGTAFTYQGQLNQAGEPVNGACAMVITLWDDPVSALAANQVGPTLSFDGGVGNPPRVVVADGLFQVDLDFGASAFNVDARWLQISVCCEPLDCSDPANFTTLIPRQNLTPTPFSLATRGISVDAAGRVGIGSTNPVAKLHVAGTARVDGVLFADGTLQTTAAEELPITWTGSGDNIHNVNNGRVGIGTAAPLETLHVVSAGDHAVLGDNNNPAGTGVFGLHRADTGTTPGVLGETRSTDNNSVAVSGLASADTGFNFGGGFTTLSPDGTGVVGLHFAETGTRPGVSGHTNSESDDAVGVSGLASATTGYTSGGRFESMSVEGTGVVGTALLHGVIGEATETALGEVPVGVIGRSASQMGIGVLGEVTDTSDAFRDSWGVMGRNASEHGAGVHGHSSFPTGFTTGVLGTSASPEGIGVRGEGDTGIWGEGSGPDGVGVRGVADAETGNAVGVHGIADSPDGWAGFFSGRGYFAGRVGIGARDPDHELDVRGSVRVGGFLAPEGARTGLIVSNDLSEERAEVTINSQDAGLVKLRGTNGNDNVVISSVATKPNDGWIGVQGFSGTDRAKMFVASNAAGTVQTLGFNGSQNVVLGSSTGKRDQGAVKIMNENGDTIVDMKLNTSNQGSIQLGDASGANRLEISSEHGVGKVHARGPNGLSNVLITNSVSNANTGRIYVADVNGQPRAFMTVDEDGKGVIAADIKNFRVPNPNEAGTDIWYASVEGPEAAAYVRGTATLVEGRAVVTVPDHFKAVAVESGMTVQVTPLSGDSLGLAVVRKSLGGIEVRELHAGRGNYDFDYRVTAVRQGHEEFRVVRPSAPEAIASEERFEPASLRGRPSRVISAAEDNETDEGGAR